MKIAMVASEAAPFLKTGGLGDVMQGLPAALSREPENEVVLILPYYGKIKADADIETEFVTGFQISLAWRRCYVGLHRLKTEGSLQVWFVDNEQYFDRDTIYGQGDDGERFAFFSRAVPACLNAMSFWPNVIHCNDWQTALIPVLMKTEFASVFPGTKTVFTIHNVEYQGWAGHDFNYDVLGLGGEVTDVLEMNGSSNFMKAAIVAADSVTTVSETYAEELRWPYFAHGMDSVLQFFPGKLRGITNGIDCDAFDPETDKRLPVTYNAQSFESAKKENKLSLQRRLGLEADGDVALLAIVTRLVEHKGVDLITHIADRLMLDRKVQFVLLGTGESRYEEFFRGLEARYPGRVASVLQFDGGLANRIYAAADLYLMPSKSEPCGLSQIIAMRYGTVPVVHAVGGLKDTVWPYEPETGLGRGFTFQSYNADDFFEAIDRALALYYDEPQKFRALQQSDMRQDFSWQEPAQRYMALYHEISGK